MPTEVTRYSRSRAAGRGKTAQGELDGAKKHQPTKYNTKRTEKLRWKGGGSFFVISLTNTKSGEKIHPLFIYPMGEKVESRWGSDGGNNRSERPRTPEEIAAEFDDLLKYGGPSAVARASQKDPEIEAELIQRWLAGLPVPAED